MTIATADQSPVKSGVISFSLSLPEEPFSAGRAGEPASGFLAECCLGPVPAIGHVMEGNRHIRFREFR